MLHSTRARVAALVVAAVTLTLAVVGVVTVESFASREGQAVDSRLRERPASALAAALRRARANEGLGTPLPLPLRDGDLFARLSRGGLVVAQQGTPSGLAPTGRVGLRSVEAGGERYRVLARRLPGGGTVEVGTALRPSEDRVSGLRLRVTLLSVAGVVASGLAAWALAGLALRPLRELRVRARRVSTTRDLSTRLPERSGAEEVDAVATSVNAMLGRLEHSAAETDRALEATRRFAADAGHELRTPLTALRANLAALARNPDMDPVERRTALEEAEEEAGRTARLLESLQLLARGDAGASLPRTEVDLDELLDLSLERAARRHPTARFALDSVDGEHQLVGWADGLASMVDNLLDNAARHGRERGRITASLAREGDRLALTVDDDGPGIPEADRARLFERFARGEGAGEGSGLGLALVRQQAELHGGYAAIEASPAGGARLTVTLAAQPISEATTAS